MDQAKIGKFIAERRKKADLTQGILAENSYYMLRFYSCNRRVEFCT